MLPILRILPVGGVLLAILILVLALIPPEGSRAPLSPEVVPTRSAFLDRDRRPEARQFLIHAALKRADELSRLRDLPDTPVRSDTEEPKVAALPSDRSESDPDEPASINETPGVSIPVEVGEPSSSELPVTEANAPATKSPEPAKREVRRRVHRVRYARPAPPLRPFNFFEALFGGPQYQQAYANQQASQRYPQPTPTYGSPQATYGATYGTPQTAYGTVQQPGQRYQSPQTNPAIVPVVPGTNSY
jgi:hypothetical protein